MSALPRRYPGLHRLPLSGSPRLVAPDPPPALAPEAFASRLYGMLAPLAQQDESAAWSLLILCNAIGGMYELVEEWVRDTPDGPGWSLLVDVDRCPPEALGWLAQFVGVRLLPGTSDTDQRERIVSTDGFRRGTPDAMRSAAAATLTPPKYVVFRERAGGDAYALDVTTYTAQTPDPVATERALIAQKPAGIVLNYACSDGQTYQIVNDTNADYAAVKTKYHSYQAMLVDMPAAALAA